MFLLVAAAMMWTQPLLAGNALEGGQKDKQKEVSGPSAQPEMTADASMENLVDMNVTESQAAKPSSNVTTPSIAENLNSTVTTDVVAKPNQKVKPMKVLREAKKHDGGSTFGILALVFGLLGFLLAFLFWPIGLLFGVIAIVMGAIGLGGGRSGKGMAIVGLIFGILTIIIPVLIIALVIALFL